MALIYASAVNRRMNALQKKNSADITPHSHNQHSELFQHCKQRSNEDSPIPNVFDILNNENNGIIVNEKKQYRKMSNAKNNKHSNPIINENAGNDVFEGNGGSNTTTTNSSTYTNSGGSTNSNNKAAALLQFQQQLLLQQQQNNQQKKGTQARDQLAALFNRLVVDDSTPRSRPHRKISTPIMAQSMTASMYGNINGEKTNGGRRRNSKKSSKPNSPISPNNDSKGHFFAKFGRAIRRRSVSADESMFRKRVGTVSSIDSSQGGEEGSSPNNRSRKTSALNRMKERLNKWKISG
ncbi:hypothetical protein ACQ4LE_005769 [Meloidogyne hapla]|uniref:Uncharacterized protein n=1 Tax=Meloidogyne hapla TaxID=6305 RepID=A0A1I8BHJ8_MELHA